MSAALAAAVVTVALLLAGCSDPYSGSPGAAPSPTPPSRGGQTPPGPAAGDAGPTAAAPVATGGAMPRGTTRSAASVARAYARLTSNWDWNTLRRALSRAERLTAGALRAELVRTAAAMQSDESLARDRPGSRGRVVSVSARGRGPARRLVVVTSEQPLHAGRGTLEGPRAKVYTATARLTRRGWRLTAWELEP